MILTLIPQARALGHWLYHPGSMTTEQVWLSPDEARDQHKYHASPYHVWLVRDPEERLAELSAAMTSLRKQRLRFKLRVDRSRNSTNGPTT